MQQKDLTPDVGTLADDLQQRELMTEDHRVGKTIELDAELQQRGFAHTALISACEKGQVKKAMELFTGMLQNGLIPDVITYNSLISACEKGHKIDKAMELLAEMKGRGVEPNVTTYTVLISACVKGHEVEVLLELLAELYLQPGAPATSCSQMQALVVRARKGQKIDLAMSLFAEMQMHQLEMQWHTHI